MLSDSTPVATLAVRDIQAAARFYESTLGLTREQSREGTLSFHAGSTRLFVYESEFAGTNQATAATWAGVDVDAVVKTLRERGVTFEHYEMPDTTLEGDVHVSGDMRVAWFKDPDGNIHALVSE